MLLDVLVWVGVLVVVLRLFVSIRRDVRGL